MSGFDVQGSDRELIARYRAGDDAAMEGLLRRYSGYVRYFARRYSLMGGDAQDLIQEGMIGLFFAVRAYDEARDASFKTFASSCIQSKLFSALKMDARGKNQPLNHSIPLEAPLFDSNPAQTILAQCAASVSGDPVEHVIGDEAFKELTQALHGLLSPFEAQVLDQYLEGHSYQEIAEKTARPRKSIDNAIQRIRRKLDGYVSQRGITRG